MPRQCFSVYLPPHIIPEKAVWPSRTIPHWSRRWLILIMSYLVVHHHWINPGMFLSNTFVSPFSGAYLFTFLLVLPYSMVHACFSPLLQVSLLALTSLGSLALIRISKVKRVKTSYQMQPHGP